MPRIGIICPIDNAHISDEECLACKAGKTPRPGLDRWCDWSYEMLAAMLDGRGRETAYISTTMLGGCPRGIRLMANKDYYWHPGNMYYGWRGTLAHKSMEDYTQPGCISEVRFEYKFPDYPIPLTGQVDLIDVKNQRIRDYKSKETYGIPKDGPKEDNVMQLNIYRFLVKYGSPQERVDVLIPGEWEPRVYLPGEPAGIEIDELHLHYFSMGKAKTWEAPILDEEEVLDYIHPRISSLLQPKLPVVPEGLDPLTGASCLNYCPVQPFCEHLLIKEHR